MATERMSDIMPFNGFPTSTEANTGYVIHFCGECGERIFIPFTQLGDEPKVCKACYI
ncbi:MAG: hypothetical protein ABEK04_05825 [Candidatus Nanohalobium sp.]